MLRGLRTGAAKTRAKIGAAKIGSPGVLIRIAATLPAICLLAIGSAGVDRAGAQGAAAAAGLTGAKHADDVIMARQLLMDAIEGDMGAIEVAVGSGKGDLGSLKNRAYSISTLLSAFPHLFPPETKPSPNGSTTASAAVWQDFEKFYDKVQAAAGVALDASLAADAGKFAAAAKDLRAACDSCHEAYMAVAGP